jgi:predicted NBD/HSP70 family sugar kinase
MKDSNGTIVLPGSDSKTPLRAAYIRERNERLVLERLFRSGSISQSEIVALTGLKAPTVFRIFERLESDGFIEVDTSEAPARERKGRKPIRFSPVSDAMFALGADFRSGGASVTILDFSSKERASLSVPLARDVDADGAVASLIEAANEAIRASGLPRDRLLGIGVGAPGQTDLEKGEVISYPRMRGMDGFPLADRLEAAMGCPVTIRNNGTVVALAEYRRGPLALSRSLFTLLVRAGVGAGYVVDGIPSGSVGRSAFEVAHVPTRIGSALCPCGAKGCLETVLSEDALLDAARQDSMQALASAIEKGDRAALDSLGPAVEACADLLVAVRQMLFPEAFSIVTRSAALSSLLAQGVKRVFAARRIDAKVAGSVWDPTSSCRAACELVYDSYFA